MARYHLLGTISIAALGLAGPAFAQSGENPAAAATSGDQAISDIIVTASRRSDSIRNVPTAVTAISGDALKAAQIANLADLASSMPNIQISTYNNNANITIRGIGNAQINAGADAGVAVHADGVYIGQSVLTLATMNDVERVEVLRGPQGLLFGRNATGGAINVIPNRPTAELHYGIDTSVGFDPWMVRSSGYLSGPITNGVRGRLSVSQNYNQGYTRNLVPTTGKSAAPSRMDDVDSASVRAQIEAGNGPFVTRLSLEYMKDRGAGPSQWLSGTPDGTVPAVLAGASRGDVSDRKLFNNYGYKNNKAKFITSVSTLQIGGGELKATASYGETNIVILTDGDGTAVDHTSTFQENDARQTYGELIYASDAGKPLSLIVGANYFHESLSQDISVPISILPPPLDVLGAVTVNLGADSIKSESYAGFGQVQYRPTDALRLFAGLRYTHDRKSISNYNNFGVSPATGSEGWGRVTYEFGASYKFSPAITGYAKYGTGYKGGGFSAGAAAIPFDPETNTNIEVGLKGNYFGGVLQANLAAFRMKYKDLQVNQIVGPLVQVTNAARATGKGVEAEIKLRPVPPLHFDLNASWLDAKFDEFFTRDDARPTFLPDSATINGVVVQGIQLAGNALPNSPKYSASGGAYYDIPVDGATVTLGARYDWKSRVYFSEFNIPVSSQKAIGKLNLSARYVSADGRWNASIFALNVTNRQVKENVVVVSSLIGSLGVTRYQPARQIGASVGYKF